MKRGSAEAKSYLSRVAALGCAMCRRLGYGESQAEIHHQRTGMGTGRRADDAAVIPLCPSHHRQGKYAFHALGRKAWERMFGITELELIEQTQRELGYDPTE